MIEWSIEALRASDPVRAIVVAVPPGQGLERGGSVREEAGASAGAGADRALTVVDGGATRAQSVVNALAAVETDLVAIHDAARPLLTSGLVQALVADLVADPEAAGVIAAAPVVDTIKRAEGKDAAFTPYDVGKVARTVECTLDRTLLWAAQTPQVFRAAALREALAVDADTRDAATDEAMLVEAAGGKVLIHPAPPENFKVTTPHDLRVAELLLSDRGAPR